MGPPLIAIVKAGYSLFLLSLANKHTIMHGVNAVYPNCPSFGETQFHSGHLARSHCATLQLYCCKFCPTFLINLAAHISI